MYIFCIEGKPTTIKDETSKFLNQSVPDHALREGVLRDVRGRHDDDPYGHDHHVHDLCDHVAESK